MKNTLKLLFILPFVLFFAGCSNTANPESSQAQKLQNTVSSGFLTIDRNNIDLGDIPIQGGNVDIPFDFRNDGNGPVALFEGVTSCMCTEAVVKSDDGITSPRIKMNMGGRLTEVNQVLEPGERAELIATFNPLAHGPNALGPIMREVVIKTNSLKTPEIKFNFYGNVVKGNKKIANIPSEKQNEEVQEPFIFEETSYDFGVIKQSGGKVIHSFPFTYQGREPVQIIGVPTSCACTAARVEPTNRTPGDSGVLTVKFNPNLHEEPEGKFFKTISLLTEPSLGEMPEVKIWAQIDLDLGREAFELSSDHQEEDESHEEPQYNSITPEVFRLMLQKKDFVLIDTHIPEQEHIDGTDLFIPYDRIEGAADLPEDKNTKIVLYCRSGGMSRAAAYQLVEDGYTNVYDLVGGKNAYDQLLQP